MPTDYNKIRTDNIREYGEGTRHLSFLGRLYTDRTHFVFELLQNAEDAGATRILFSLFDDRLEVTHDGRLFNELDVRGVCGVGEGTKTEDLTQIGKFGIGFKSVYAYTATPEVHSGSESFKIEHYVRPCGVSPTSAVDSKTTLFILPFNVEEMTPDTACDEIASRLRTLSARTLLFLRSISEIEYKLPDSTGGVYLRQEHARGLAREVSVIGQSDGGEEEETWLIYERPVPVPERPESVRVEVSFRLEPEDKAGKNPERIVKVSESPLVAYFSTERATRFGFLIQGPYRTTPSRDNVPKDDKWNETLIRDTAELMNVVLHEIKDCGLMSVSLLEALPIRTVDFPKDGMFYPIVESVRNAFLKAELLPADDGSFVSADKAKLARGADLKQLLDQAQLCQLYESQVPVKWLSGEITQDRTPDLRSYLINRLGVEEVTPEDFARRVNLTFFEKQSDQWMIAFYTQLRNQGALWEKRSHYYGSSVGPLRRKPFIRLDDGSHVAPFDGSEKPNAYLPTRSLAGAGLPTVKSEIASNDEARDFLLSHLRLAEVDVVAEVVEHVLPKYRLPMPPMTDEHLRDIEKILEALEVDSQDKQRRLKEALQETPFIQSRSALSGEEGYRRPGALYFADALLEVYFSGFAGAGFVSSIYQETELKAFARLGVRKEVRVVRQRASCVDFVRIREHHGDHERGLSGFDPDIRVEGLSVALSSPTREKSLFIWNRIVLPNAECILGIVETSSRQTYEYSRKEERISEAFGRLLMDNKWLPGRDERFVAPAELSMSDLPDQFERNERLAQLLGMKKDVVAKLAEEVGISCDDIDFIRCNVDEFRQWKSEVSARKDSPVFPTRPVANPERRQERLGEQTGVAPDKGYEKRERSVRTTTNTIDPITWLRKSYTNRDDQMVCQICKEEMPFRKRDGTHYFEKKEVLSRKYLPKEHEPQYLALCPVCAAKYEEFVKTDDEVMEQLKEDILSAEGCDIPVSLGDQQTSIRFVETHYQDIRSILSSCG